MHLGRERSEAEGRHFASIMFAEARRLTALVENVLRFSRLEHGEPRLRLRQQPLGEVLTNAVSTFAPIAEAAEVSIGVRASANLHASVDTAAIHQIVLNLLDNAVKHGGRGGRVEVSTSVRDGMAVVMVDDAGPGIQVAEREHVFEPFAQLDGHHVAGAGIGLAIVRDLVLAHGGRVWIDDSPLGGARVVIALPARGPVTVPGPPRAHAVG